MKGPKSQRDPDETCDVGCLAAQVFSERGAGVWMASPNDQLGGERPSDLIGKGEGERVRELLRAIKHGMPT
jgi:uncharacterized protein (DUF2384 family)